MQLLYIIIKIITTIVNTLQLQSLNPFNARATAADRTNHYTTTQHH